jgi:predicted dehydrogenase
MATVGILGSGKTAKARFDAYRRNRAIERIVLWGRNEGALRSLSRRFSSSAFYLDYAEMLEAEKPCGVSVCLPPHLREAYIVPALEQGAHVLCEKPLALSMPEALSIRDASRRHNRHVLVGYTLRFLPEIQELKAAITSGRLGPVKVIFFRTGRGLRRDSWRNDPDKSMGVFDELGIHGIDLARYLIDDDVVSVKSQVLTSHPQRNVIDQGSAILRFRKGAMAVVSCSFSYPFFENELAVIGTRSSVKVSRSRLIERAVDDTPPPGRLFARSLLEGLYLPWRYLLHPPFQAETNHFIDCALSGTPPLCDVETDVETLRICIEISSRAEEAVLASY